MRFRAVLETNGRTATGIEVPAEVVESLGAAQPDARRFFDGLSYSQQRWFVSGIEDAKTAQTRQRRIDQAVARLADGRGQR